MEYLTSNNKLAVNQNWNRKFHSKDTALLNVTDQFLQSIDMDGKKVSIMDLLDMSKAFNSIRHDIVLSKLQRSTKNANIRRSLESDLRAAHR